MNLQNIDNVSDLLAMNEAEKDAFETAIEALTECDYSQSRAVVLWLVTNMIDFHKENAVRTLKGEQEGSIIAWVADTTKLETAIDLLKEVD